MKQTKVVIYGFGRMGLTHYSILNQLLDNADFTFIDVNKKLNFFAKKNLNANLLDDDKYLQESFDYSLVCTPPMFHVDTVEKCLARGDNKIFVEKPFGGVNDDFSRLVEYSSKIKIGYVMRFNPVINWVKENIRVSDVVNVEGSYFSNTIENKPSGWRNGSYSGVLNEMGAHIIDLAVYLFELKSPRIQEKQIESVITDVDDIVKLRATDKGIDYQFHFNWISKNVRKPVFNIKVKLEDGRIYRIDQQKVEVYHEREIEKAISVVDLSENVPYYLRGVDFTKQMQDLIDAQETLATVEEALITRNLIKNTLT